MAVTRHTLTGDFGAIIGGDFASLAGKAVLSTNLRPGEALVDQVANEIQVGTALLPLDANGVLQGTSGAGISLIATNSADTNIDDDSLRYRVTLSYIDAATRKRAVWDSDFFELTANADLSDVAGTIEAPLSWRSAFITEFETLAAAAIADAETAGAEQAALAEAARDLAEQYRDEAHDISGIDTSDDVVELLIKPGAPGPKTKAALSASTVAKVDQVHTLDPITDDEPGVVVCFGPDDGYTRQAGDVAVLNALGVPVTMWVTKEWVDGTSTGTNASWGDTYMTEAQVQTIAAHAVGNEIGYHGVVHENHITRLTSVGADGLYDIIREGIDYCESTFTDHVGDPVVVVTGAYPGGQSDPRVREVTARAGLKFARGTLGTITYNPPDPYQVPGYDILAPDLATIKAKIDQAVTEGGVLNLLWHSTGDNTVSTAFRTKLGDLVAYCQSLGIPMLTFRDAMERRTWTRGVATMTDRRGNHFAAKQRTYQRELTAPGTVARRIWESIDDTNGYGYRDSDGTPWHEKKPVVFEDQCTVGGGSGGFMNQPLTAQAVGTLISKWRRSSSDTTGPSGEILAVRNGGGLRVYDAASAPGSAPAGAFDFYSLAGKPRFKAATTAITGSAPQDVAASIVALLVAMGIATDSTTTWSPAPDALATLAVLRERSGQMNALSASSTGRVLLTGATPPVTAAAAGGADGAFYFDPADHAVAGHTTKMRLRLVVHTNDVAPGGDLSAILKPVSAPAGAATITGITLGSAVTGATATVTAPAANTQSHAETALFDVPAAGYYTIVISNPTAMTASSAVAVNATLSIKNV